MRSGMSAEPQPTSSSRGRGDDSRNGRTAARSRRCVPSQRLTRRRSARLSSASASETPSSSSSVSVARELRSTLPSSPFPARPRRPLRSKELEQSELRPEAGPERPENASLPPPRPVGAQDLVEDEQHRHRAHVAVLGQDGLGGGEV